MSIEQPSLFPELVAEPAPAGDGGEYLGKDARRTRRQLEVLATGYNPGSGVRLHTEAAAGRSGPGLRCGGCVHLYRTGAGNKNFLKCEEARGTGHGSWGPDMRRWWPACVLYSPADPDR